MDTETLPVVDLICEKWETGGITRYVVLGEKGAVSLSLFRSPVDVKLLPDEYYHSETNCEDSSCECDIIGYCEGSGRCAPEYTPLIEAGDEIGVYNKLSESYLRVFGGDE